MCRNSSSFHLTFVESWKEPSVNAEAQKRKLYGFNSDSNLPGLLWPKSGAVKAILGFNPPNGTKLRKWNPDSNSWQESTHTAGNWTPSDPVIGFGEGFLVEAPSAYTWKKAFTIW